MRGVGVFTGICLLLVIAVYLGLGSFRPTALIDQSPSPDYLELPQWPTPLPIYDSELTLDDSVYVRVMPHDLIYTVKNEKPVELFSVISRNYHKALMSEPLNRGCSDYHYFKVIALVGTMVSFEHELDFACGSVSTGHFRYSTIDIARQGKLGFESFPEFYLSKQKKEVTKEVSLTDLFPETVVFEALIKNQAILGEVTSALAEMRLDKTPSNLSELIDFLTSKKVFLFERRNRVPEDFLRRFAFESFESNGQINLSMSLLSTVKQTDSSRRQIDLSLPASTSFFSSLSRERGFLTRDGLQSLRKQSISFEY